MTRKIYRSTFITTLLVLIVSLALVIGILLEHFEKRLLSELQGEANYIVHSIENSGYDVLRGFKDDAKRITLIDKNGTVIKDTIVNPSGLDNHINREEVKEALEKGKGSSVRYSDTISADSVYYAKKMRDGSILRVSTHQYSTMMMLSDILYPLIIVFALAFILCFILSGKVADGIIRPINELDLENPDKNNSYEELSPLLRKISQQNNIIKSQLREATQKQEEFKLITENMEEGFLVIDSKTNLLSYNTSALKLFDIDKSEIKTIFDIRATKEFKKIIAKALKGERAERRLNYTDYIYNLIANPVFENKNVIGVVIVIIDITGIAKAESMRSEFTANVSHELKTPLTSISGFAELMKDGDTSPETVADFSASIYDEAQRLITLVNDIIKISELDEKSFDYREEYIDLQALAASIAKRLDISASKKNITMAVHGDTCELKGVRKIIDEMLHNLCDNAIKYNKENGRVDVTVTDSKDKIKVSVKDTGIGIPQAEQDRVFERFYRVDKGRSKAEGGTGLGLSIVKHGAIYHNAEISLTSKLGVGTEVVITFNKA